MSDEILATGDPVLDGDLSAKKLLDLIQLGREEDGLDYKEKYPLDKKDKKGKVDFVCDAVAMANTNGGYIVLGVADNLDPGTKYTPVGLSDDQIRSLDVTNLKNWVGSYINDSFELSVKDHKLDQYEGKTFALIFVPQSKTLPIIFSKDGAYEKKSKFFKGDIYVRRNVSSTKADQNDMRRIISHIRQREKESWTKDILELIANTGSPGTNWGEASYDEAMFYIGNSEYEKHIINLLDAGRKISVRQYCRKAAPVLYKNIDNLVDKTDDVLQQVIDNKILPILDSLTVICLVAVELGKHDILEAALTSLYTIFRQAKYETFPQPQDRTLHFSPSLLWKEIVIRIYSLGIYLVNQGHFDLIGLPLIRQKITWDSSHNDCFIVRYTLARLANENRPISLCHLAAEHTKNNEYLNERFVGDDDEVLDFSCQFDFLQCVHILDQSGDLFPSFGGFYNSRTNPVIEELIRDSDARRGIPQLSDNELAIMLVKLDKMAHREFALYAGWEENEWTKTIRDFISENLSK